MGAVLSSWALSWDCSWGDAWGPCSEGGGSATKTKRRKKRQGWANELEILRRSLEKPEPVALKAPPKRVKIVAPKPAKTYTVERVGGQELIEEARQIKAAINAKMDAFKAGEIARAELDAFVESENEAIEVIMMALDLDKHVILSIIT